MMQHKHRQLKSGFTLIELLTVISVIALIMAVLSVGGREVRIRAQGLKQKAVFNAITVGLEVFRNDFDRYPDSAQRSESGSAIITGAQHLAEAMVGRDERGFEPQTGWYPPDDTAYRLNAPGNLYTTEPSSLARRKDPYMEFRDGGVYSIGEMWQGDTAGSQVYTAAGRRGESDWSPVISDIYTRTQVTLDNGETARVGMPILYFKADPTKLFRVNADRTEFPEASYDDDLDYAGWVYNFKDNVPILNLPWLRDTTMASDHYADPTRSRAFMFYEQITQSGADAGRGFFRPYNQNSFILISAGWDGVFGTRHDIVNFD